MNIPKPKFYMFKGGPYVSLVEYNKVSACLIKSEEENATLRAERDALQSRLDEATELLVKADNVMDMVGLQDRSIDYAITKNVRSQVSNFISLVNPTSGVSGAGDSVDATSSENCRGLSVDHRWVSGEFSDKVFCSKCGVQKP